MTPNQTKRPQQTLYMSQDDLRVALITATSILTSESLHKDSDGYATVEALCEKLKATKPQLAYINRNHIVELYFKDQERKIFINGLDRIKYKIVRYVTPPDVLYFGTLTKVSCKMRQYGIKSDTKGYVKLYETPAMAEDFARKFLRDPNDKIEVLKINAAEAFKSGMKFSTFTIGQYIVVRIDKKFIMEVQS